MRYPKEFDVNIRLHNTYAWYDGTPVFCHGPGYSDSFSPGLEISIPTITESNGVYKINHKNSVINPNDEKFDARPFKIGWTSTYFGHRPTYIMRQPQRSQRAGMSLNNCYEFVPKGHSIPSPMGQYITIFASMYDIYVSNFAEATKNILNGSLSVSLSKDFAVFSVNNKNSKNFSSFVTLYYKYFAVGVINIENMSFYMQKDIDDKVCQKVNEFLSLNSITKR